VGADVAEALVPRDAPIQEPIVPTRWPQPRVRDDWRMPERPNREESRRKGAGSDLASLSPLLPFSSVPASNNWAVHGSRTVSGSPLLAGDPHLDLSLPSIWYELHIVVPDTLDVYGASFPGAPAVPIGFTRGVAWSFTNTGSDQLDWWDEVLDDAAQPANYRLDGAWRRLERRVEVFRGPGGAVLAEDTLYFTHRGPLTREGDRGRSMRWTTLEYQGFLEGFLGILTARSVVEWLSAFQAFRAPTQNGVVADRAGDIALVSTGRFPVRAGDGDGRTVRDGTVSANDWLGDLDFARWPFVRNPPQGYVASANQQPIDPRADPAYFGAGWETPWRALRINALLRADTAVTPEAMQRYQTDPGSARADWFLPVMRRAGERQGGTARQAAQLLAQWDGRYTRDNERAVLFEAAMVELRDRAFDALRAPDGRLLVRPSESVLAMLLGDSAHAWWDGNRDSVIATALAAALDTVVGRHGPPEDGGWRWDRLRFAQVWHLLRLPALSVLDVPLQGGPGLLNPSSGSGTHGASWRMVVDLGTSLRAWSTYPGGQSGNPMSRWYANRMADWSQGRLERVHLPRSAGELAPAERTGAVTAPAGGSR
jgi:penicillin amidase